MPRRQSKDQKETIGRVMHEYKHDELVTSRGTKVKSPKQAIAIALHEAGASKYESERKNRDALRRTKARERKGTTGRAEPPRPASRSRGAGRDEKSRAELYAEARRRHIPGRSRMGKDELKRALGT